MKPVVLTITDIVNIIKGRRLNNNDSRIAFTGETGEGKSTVAGKILFRFDDFDAWKYQVYTRDDVISLLKSQKAGFCWDDESIESSFNLEFQNKNQQELTKILTKYRSNLNTYFSVLPEFFTLNKNIRDLFFMHIHVISRGVAVVHMKNKWALYTKDKWDSQENAKIERSWVKMRMKNPNFKPLFHKLSTFRGYLFFNDLTPKQRKLVEEIKEVKRAKSDDDSSNESEKPLIEKLYDMLIEGKLNKESLQTICIMEQKKYSSVTITLNRMLKDAGEKKTVKNFFELSFDKKEQESTEQTKNLVPEF